jgi:hypothetical protein
VRRKRTSQSQRLDQAGVLVPRIADSPVDGKDAHALGRKLGLPLPQPPYRARKNGGYWLVTGYHRLKAVMLLGWTEIKA